MSKLYIENYNKLLDRHINSVKLSLEDFKKSDLILDTRTLAYINKHYEASTYKHVLLNRHNIAIVFGIKYISMRINQALNGRKVASGKVLNTGSIIREVHRFVKKYNIKDIK